MNWGHLERGKVLLLAGDATIIGTELLIVRLAHPVPQLGAARAGLLLALCIAVYVASFYTFELYDLKALNAPRIFARLAVACAAGTSVLSVSLYGLHALPPGRTSAAIAVALLFAAAFAWRLAYGRHHPALLKKKRAILIGSPEDAALLDRILRSDGSPCELLGFLQPSQADATEPAARALGLNSAAPRALAAAAGASATSRAIRTAVFDAAPNRRGRPITLGLRDPASVARIRDFGPATCSVLTSVAGKLEIAAIVVREAPASPELARTLTELRFGGVRIVALPDLCSQILEELPLETLTDAWFSFASGFDLLHRNLFRKLKRLADIVLAAAGLLVTLPLSVLIAAAVKLESPGPVLFQQYRVGWNEQPFEILKFRSMRQDAEADGRPRWASARDPRVTRVGRILRALHLDEIPQMLNVFRGEMSFVGPRPERPEFVAELKQAIPFYSLRHHVPPGITGWAQVNYPYGASVADAKRKLQYDLFYVRHASPTLDLRILLRTARVILYRRGSR